tara:strand:- start:1567 stop:1809 length:243 start_codon:yes stop_codon:yes gene_type:complete
MLAAPLRNTIGLVPGTTSISIHVYGEPEHSTDSAKLSTVMLEAAWLSSTMAILSAKVNTILPAIGLMNFFIFSYLIIEVQ